MYTQLVAGLTVNASSTEQRSIFDLPMQPGTFLSEAKERESGKVSRKHQSQSPASGPTPALVRASHTAECDTSLVTFIQLGPSKAVLAPVPI